MSEPGQLPVGPVPGGEDAGRFPEEHRLAVGRGHQLAVENRKAMEAVWGMKLQRLIERLGRKDADLATSGKTADWKIAIAAALKARTTVTNRWLATTLHLGNLYEVSRKVAVWMRNPEPTLAKKLQITPNPKT